MLRRGSVQVAPTLRLRALRLGIKEMPFFCTQPRWCKNIVFAARRWTSTASVRWLQSRLTLIRPSAGLGLIVHCKSSRKRPRACNALAFYTLPALQCAAAFDMLRRPGTRYTLPSPLTPKGVMEWDYDLVSHMLPDLLAQLHTAQRSLSENTHTTTWSFTWTGPSQPCTPSPPHTE